MVNILFETFLIVFLAEMGDKSQFLMIAMTAEYKLRHILIGTALSVVVLTLLAVGAGSLIGDLLPQMAISLIAGVAFLLFALFSVGADGEEEQVKRHKCGAILSVFGTYFLAELGDKTQLSALALSAGAQGSFWQSTVPVFAGCVIALYLADLLGLAVGIFLDRRLPREAFRFISVLLFFICGALRLLDGFFEAFDGSAHPIGYAVTSTVSVSVFFALCIAFRFAHHKKERSVCL